MSKADDLGKGADVDEHSRAAVVRGDHITGEREACAGRQSSVGEGGLQIGLDLPNCIKAVWSSRPFLSDRCQWRLSVRKCDPSIDMESAVIPCHFPPPRRSSSWR